MAGKPIQRDRGLSGPMRALAWTALAAGVAVCALKLAAVAQELRLPTILRPSTLATETIDGPDPNRRLRPRLDPATLPRSRKTPANPAQKPVRPGAAGAEATQKVQPDPLKRVGAPALTALAPPPAPRRRIETDPYAPAGIAAGSFVIRPSLDIDAGYDSNPNRLRGVVKGSTFVKPGAEIAVDSNWSTHSFQGFLRGAYSYYPSLQEANRPELEAKGNWRFDMSRSTQIVAETRAKIETQSPQTTDLPFVTSGRPLTYQFGATLGADHTINRFTVGLRGTVDRTFFDDAKLPTGIVVDQSDRNYTQIGGALRFGYEWAPGLKPFVEARIDRRRHDESVDSAGFLRDSTGMGVRAGVAIALERTLVGEVALGYERRKYEDPRLTELRGLVGDASLIWSASPLTSLGLRAQTTLDETTSPGVAGAVTRKGTIEIAHAFLRNLILTGTFSFQRADYQGAVPALTEDTVAGSVRLDYKLSRTVSVRASYAHERLRSTAPGADYTANIFMVGLRLQR